MRVTNTLFYSTSVTEHQSAMKKLYDIDKQLASGMKIQNSFENSSVYVDTMRLNYEIATLEQTKESSSKAQTFALNTDSTLNQMEKALEQFKTKLIQANSSTQSSTSLNAIADELEGIKKHMISLGNTSINGQFLFSGTSLLQKPLDDDGEYLGNSESLTALIGSGVELPYNTDGNSLFLGLDSDYNRVISTNVSMLNQSKLNPSTMVEENENLSSAKVYLTASDTIRDLVGDTNTNTTDDPKPVFYLSGRKSDGTTFAETIAIDSTSTVSDLLEKIGNAYGNTSSNKVVDVSMNARGQIEIKDLKQGNQLLEMNLFGAVDRSAGAGLTGDALQTMNSDNLLLKDNVDIINFQKSNFGTTLSSPDLTMRAKTINATQFSLDFPVEISSGITITTATDLIDLFPSDVDHLEIAGTRFPVAGSLSGLKVQDLLTAIPGSTLSNNQLIVTSDVTITSFNAANAPAKGNLLPDSINYTRRGFEKEGNELQGNISQIIKSNNAYATASTKLIDVAGVSSLNGKQLILNFTDVNGVSRTGTLNLDSSDTTFSIDLDSDGIINANEPNEIISIYNGKGDPLNTKTKADEMTYQQLMDVVSMVTSGNLPKQGVTTTAQTAINDAIAFGVAGDAANLATQTALAKTGVSTETAKYIQKAIDAGILRDDPASTPDVVAQATLDYNDAIANANLTEYNYALNSAKNNVDVTLDNKGQLQIIDKKASQTKIEFTMYDKSATDFTGVGSVVLSFMANDAIAISNPSIDLFKDLDAMIKAVRTGTTRMDADSEDPRNIGLQNALSQLDHILDHVTKEHTKIGAYSNALGDANERAEYLSLNVKTVRSSVIDVDTAEAYLQFNQISNSYQAMLSTIAKINSMSLLNYM